MKVQSGAVGNGVLLEKGMVVVNTMSFFVYGGMFFYFVRTAAECDTILLIGSRADKLRNPAFLLQLLLKLYRLGRAVCC